MRNIKLTLQYDGTAFNGFAPQPGKRTVYSEIEEALKRLFKQKVKFYATSRTDSGVHAAGQAISFKINHRVPAAKIKVALNSFLPDEIKVIKSEETPESFNARFSPKSKVYEYLIYNGKTLNPVFRNFVWQVKPKLNLLQMRRAAKSLVGKHDFSSFRAAGADDKDATRTLYQVKITKEKIALWEGCQLPVVSCQLKGNAFLYKMVRNMVGTLVDIGIGKINPDEIKNILDRKNRKTAGRCAPAQGLCLVRVNF